MTRGQKILLGVGVLGVAIGGFVLAKFLTRNTRKYQFYSITLSTDSTPAMSSEDVE